MGRYHLLWTRWRDLGFCCHRARERSGWAAGPGSGVAVNETPLLVARLGVGRWILVSGSSEFHPMQVPYASGSRATVQLPDPLVFGLQSFCLLLASPVISSAQLHSFQSVITVVFNFTLSSSFSESGLIFSLPRVPGLGTLRCSLASVGGRGGGDSTLVLT